MHICKKMSEKFTFRRNLVANGLVSLQLYAIPFPRYLYSSETCLVEMILERVLGGALAVNDKGLAYLRNILATREIVYHFAVITMTRESLYLGHLRTNAVVIAKYTYIP